MGNKTIAQFVRRELRAVTMGLATAIGIGGGLPAAMANPVGGTVVSGAGSITHPNATTTVINQATGQLTLNWSSFNVGANESVEFKQPSASSVALNQIMGQSPSQIFGQIDANGRVVLVNPNGILFGRTAQLNVGSLIASSLAVTGFDAANGRFSFQALNGKAGAIVNDGTITAHGGSVALLGGTVLNNGLVVADYGTVAMGAGKAATLDFYGGGLLRIKVSGDLTTNPTGAGAAVTNNGSIQANGGQVMLTASATKQVFASAVNNTGVIRANRIAKVGGVIELTGPDGAVTDSGTLDASGKGAASTGGTVTVTGQSVTLASTAKVNVSGPAGGGSAFIGGGLHGADSAIPDAATTTVDAGASIRADATHAGNGGTIAVWSNGKTTAHGQLSADGGPAGGNGGMIETSGHVLDVNGISVHAAAAAGKAGTWLLDPTNVIIDHGTGSSITGTNPATNGNGGSPVYDGDINAALASGTDVTVQTSSPGASSPTTTGSITFGTGVSIVNNDSGATRTLTLSADTGIDMTAGPSISTGTGFLNLVLKANANGQASASLGTVAIDGTISVNSLTVSGTGAITQPGGTLTVNGATTLNAGTGSITLGQSNVFFGNVAFSGDNVILTAGSGAFLSSSGTASGNLTETDLGGMVQGGTLQVAGASTLQAGNSAITLNDPTNSFTGNVAFSGGPVTLVNSGALSSSGTAGGNLAETAGGTISEGAAGIQVAGGNTVAFTLTGAGDINLGAAANNFNGDATTLGTSGAGSIGNVWVADANATGFVPLTLPALLTSLVLSDPNAPITLPAETLAGVGAGTNLAGGPATLAVTAGGAITQGGALNVTGTSALSAGGNAITLSNTSNSFTGNVGFTGGTVTLSASGALSSSGTATGNLSETATGAITQGGALQVTGLSTLDAGSNAITLGNAGNSFTGNVGFTGGTVTLASSGALSTSGTATGNLSETATGAITQGGALTVSGTSTLNAGSNAITLGYLTNSFTGNVGFVGGAVTLVNTGALSSSGTASGALAETAGGTISEGAAGIQVLTGNTAAFTLTGSGDINLGAAANNFNGDLTTLRAVGAGSIGNVWVADANATAFVPLTLPATLKSLVLSDPNAPVAIPAVTLTGVGVGTNLAGGPATLAVTAGGAITQGGALNVTGTSALSAGGNAITLSNTSNSFTGNVGFTGGTVTLSASGALSSSGTASGNLSETATGAITQGGALQVTGASTLDAGSNAITLGNASNSFTGNVGFTGGTVTLSASGALSTSGTATGNLSETAGGAITQAAALTVSGTSSFLAGNNAITLINPFNKFTGNVDFTGGAVAVTDSVALSSSGTASGNLSETAAAGIEQTVGALLVGGTTTLNAGTGAIALGNTGNQFSGNVAFTGGAVTLASSGALSSSGSASGSLSETAGGKISEGAAGIQLAVGNSAVFTVTGAGDDINLGAAANNFNGDATTLQASGAGSVANVWVADSNTTAFVPLNLPGTLTSLVLSGPNVPIALPAQTLSGVGAGTNLAGGSATLEVTAGGAITQSGAVDVAGTSALTANNGASDITLGGANAFGGNVAFSGHNVVLTTGTGGLSSSGTAGGTLTETAAGTITQGGALSVTGASTLSANSGASDITLGGANTFGGNVAFTGHNVTLTTGSGGLSSSGTAGGTLTETAAGAITQGGALSVTGASTLTANNGGSDITLGGANTFGGNVAFSGYNVTLADSTGGLSTSGTASGTLTETAAGTITQGGALSVTGASTLSANSGASDITLGGANTFGGNVAFTGHNVTLTTGTGGLSSSGTAGGTLTESAAGAITQGGGLSVGGASTLTANNGASDITLGGANTFGGNVAFTGHNVTLTAGTGGLSSSGTAGGTLTESAAGAITQGGALSVAGASTLTANNGAADITLGGANTFGGNVAFSGHNVALTTGTGGLSSSGTAGGTLTETAAGAITQGGALSVAGVSTLAANNGAADITLGASNTFGGNVAFSGNNVSLTDGTGGLSTSGTAGGTLTESAAGAITQGGALSVTGASTLTANSGASDITLAGANTFGGNVAFSGANVTLSTGAGGLSSTGTAGGTLTETAAGAITEGGVLNVAGASTLTAANGAADITLAGANTFGGNVAFKGDNVMLSTGTLSANQADLSASGSAAGSLTLRAEGAPSNLTVGTITAGGNVLLIAGDNILGEGASSTLTANDIEARYGIQNPNGQLSSASAGQQLAWQTSSGATITTTLWTPMGTQSPTKNIALPSGAALKVTDISFPPGIASLEQSLYTSPFGVTQAQITQGSAVSLTSTSFSQENPFEQSAGDKGAAGSANSQLVYIDWASYNPNVSLFGTLNPAVCLPADQRIQGTESSSACAAPASVAARTGTATPILLSMVLTRAGWREMPLFALPR